MLDKLPGFVPKDLKQLLAFVPTRGWDAIEWRPLLSQLRRISWQLASQKGVAKLARSAAAQTDALRVGDDDGRDLASLGARQRKAAGDAILRFYFAQWRNPEGLFLDLRGARFAMGDDGLCFHPSGLWVRLEDEFRLGMIDLYRGFYLPDPELLDDALYRMGFLRDDLTAQEADELRALLQAHFGSQQRSQAFAIDTFKASFDALFDFFIDHDYRLRSDFVMVGFYLITLYLVLEELGQHHDVKALCEAELMHERGGR
jgi:predicted unusual protein kinase regulating ubiquinone biosynthesis (AarF/ABC1/UbiB family)